MHIHIIYAAYISPIYTQKAVLKNSHHIIPGTPDYILVIYTFNLQELK